MSEPLEEMVPAELFDEDYLYFYETFLTPEGDDRDAALIAQLVGPIDGLAVLDAPCGHGRMSRRLAAAGARVTGIDRSEVFLERARADASAERLAITYQPGDLRSLPVQDGCFDVALNWYTSFGYFDDDGNARALGELHRALRPGGRLCLEVMNPAAVIRSVSARSGTLPSVTWQGEDHMIDETSIDLERGLAQTRHSITRHGRTRTLRYSLRFMFPTELRALLHQVGFGGVRMVSESGGRLLITSQRMIVLATRDADR
jgi:SAM-dependent methyltransferase